MRELKRRRAMGVDVSAEMDDALRYAQKYPSLSEEFSRTASQDWRNRLFRRVRSTVADLGGRTVRRRMNAYLLTRKLKRGPMRSGFFALGDDFGFNNIVECATFIGRIVSLAVLAPATHSLATGGSDTEMIATKARRR